MFIDSIVVRNIPDSSWAEIAAFVNGPIPLCPDTKQTLLEAGYLKLAGFFTPSDDFYLSYVNAMQACYEATGTN